MEAWLDYHDLKPQNTVVGALKVLPALHSPQLDNERDILVWLPPSYAAGGRPYPVIYMHDGQNLFDALTSFCGEWGVDEAMTALATVGVEAIVVGLPNSGDGRCDEYSPFADGRHGGGCGDAYLDFIVETVKPLIDRDFRTLPDPANTGTIGSSMGGLIALYAGFRSPDVFGFVGALSPALWFARRSIFGFVKAAAAQEIPANAPKRIYLDVGTAEGAWMLRDCQSMAALLRSAGLGDRLLYVEDPNAPHAETAWAERLNLLLLYLLRDTAAEGRGCLWDALRLPGAAGGLPGAVLGPTADDGLGQIGYSAVNS